MLGEAFDLYCAPSAEPFREGAVLALDGIDGFFDQYFEAKRIGDVIRFVVLVGGAPGVPRSIDELHAMPFVTARIDRCDEVSGDVEVLSRTTLEEWCRGLALESTSVKALQREFPGAPIRRRVAHATRTGSGFWRTRSRFWTSISDTSAVAATRHDAGVRVIVLRTNGNFSLVARITGES